MTERHPESAAGDFYVVHHECLACGLPEVLAPELMAWAVSDGHHCIWKRQPETPEEIQQAIKVIHNSEAGCHRYAGTDPKILIQIDPDYCDQVRPRFGVHWAPVPDFQLTLLRPATPIFGRVALAILFTAIFIVVLFLLTK